MRRGKKEQPGDAGRTLRDLDLEFQLRLGTRRTPFLQQLCEDTRFLEEKALMDYSLLVGLRHLPEGAPSVPPQEDGGWDAGIEAQCSGHRQVVYLGLIDFLQRWNGRKQLENQIKSLLYSSVRRLSPLGLGSTDPPQEISAVPPDAYGARFRTFIEKAFAE